MKKASIDLGRLILSGKTAAESGDNTEAEKIFRQVLSIDSKNLDAHVNLGFVLLQVHEERKAYAVFKVALEIDPDSKDALRGFDIASESEIKGSGNPKNVFDDRMGIVQAKLRKDVASGDSAAIEFDKFIRRMGGGRDSDIGRRG